MAFLEGAAAVSQRSALAESWRRFHFERGELAEIATGGRLRATPHRVVNRSSTRQRISIPVFICPPLGVLVPGTEHCFTEADGHAHRVRNPAEPYAAVRFGDSEWRRKGLGQWCWRKGCLG